jgi:hypothetical protein
MRGELLKWLLNFFMQDAAIMHRASKIAANPEKRNISKRMGIVSIIFSCFALGLAIAAPFISKYLFIAGFTTNLLIFGNIFVIVLAIYILVIPFQLAAFAISYSRAQRSINTLKIGTVSKHIARIVLLLSLALLVFAVFWLLSQKA